MKDSLTMERTPRSTLFIGLSVVNSARARMYLSFALLAVTQERNWSSVDVKKDMYSPAINTRRKWWLSGIGLMLGYVLCLVSSGASFGSVLWVLLLGVCAMAVAFTLSWKPQWLCLSLGYLELAAGSRQSRRCWWHRCPYHLRRKRPRSESMRKSKSSALPSAP
jgi:hypothetical protein